MKIIVSGAAGFIGGHVAEHLLRRGDSVVGIDNFNDYYSPAQKRANIEQLKAYPEFTLYESDIRDAKAMHEIFQRQKPDRVIHLAAMANVRHSVKHPRLFIETNVMGTTHLLNAAVEVGVDHMVFASTSSVYGQRKDTPFYESDRTDLPLAPYPAGKKAGELLGHAWFNMYGLNFTALRFFNVYGPRGRPDMMPYIVLDRIRRGEEITLFDGGKLYRDWTYIDDIVSGVLAALDRPDGYDIFNLGRGEPVSMVDFMDIATRIAGAKPKIRVTKRPASDPVITYANIEKAETKLGYRPQTSLEEGLRHFWTWFQSFESAGGA